MNVLVDTNVWLDVILRRAPHYEASAEAVACLDGPDHAPYIAAHAVTTIAYLVERARDRQTSAGATGALLGRVGVAAVEGVVLRGALDSRVGDYEDAVVTAAAVRAGLDAIVTRNARDFADAELPVFTPRELIAALRDAGAE